jgi:CO/xanthine dehydrogenase Mo-binding subunit
VPRRRWRQRTGRCARTGALFCEVRLNAVTGELRVSRLLGSFDCGRILNAMTAASQFRGGMVIPDPRVPMGARGVGEIGITGVAAAVANAVYNATGKRIRDLPITLDKVLEAPRPGPGQPRSQPLRFRGGNHSISRRAAS